MLRGQNLTIFAFVRALIAVQHFYRSYENLDPEVGALVAACLTMVEHQRVRQDSNQQPEAQHISFQVGFCVSRRLTGLLKLYSVKVANLAESD